MRIPRGSGTPGPTTAQKAAQASADRQKQAPPEALHDSGALHDLVTRNPGSRWGRTQPSYLVQLESQPDRIFHALNKRHVERHFGGRSRYERSYHKDLGHKHRHGEVRGVFETNAVAPYHREEARGLLTAGEVHPLPMSSADVRDSLRRRKGRGHRAGGAAGADIPEAPTGGMSPSVRSARNRARDRVTRTLDQAFVENDP